MRRWRLVRFMWRERLALSMIGVGRVRTVRGRRMKILDRKAVATTSSYSTTTAVAAFSKGVVVTTMTMMEEEEEEVVVEVESSAI